MKPERIQFTADRPEQEETWTEVKPGLRKVYRCGDFDDAADFRKDVQKMARHYPDSIVVTSVDGRELFVEIQAAEEEFISESEHQLSERIDDAFQVLFAPMTDS